jgi:signal peptidase II
VDAPSGVVERHPLAVSIGLLVAAVFTVVDQATKELALAWLEPGRFVPWLGQHVGWQLVFNPGGAFGVGAPHWVFLIVTVIVVVVVARSLPRCRAMTTAAAYGLLLAGAVGNVLDRLLRSGGPDAPGFGGGKVVDFVAWGSFPRFNVADSAITVGFVLLVVGLALEERIAARLEREQDEPASPDAPPDGPAEA